MDLRDDYLLIVMDSKQIKIKYSKLTFVAKLYGNTLIKYNNDKMTLKMDDKSHKILIKNYQKDLECVIPEI